MSIAPTLPPNAGSVTNCGPHAAEVSRIGLGESAKSPRGVNAAFVARCLAVPTA
jgi:hypothetical protein